MTDTPAEDSGRVRLEQLLHRTHEELSDTEAGQAPTEEIEQIAEEVDEIVSSREIGQLVEDAGVSLPDDAQPETIAKAIQQGDQESVAKLRTLLLLRKLASAESETERESIVADLREIGQQFPGVGAERADEGESDRGESAQASAEEEGAAEERDQERADDAEAEEDEKHTTLHEQLEAEFDDAIGEFRENIGAFREQLREGGEAEKAEEAEAAEEAGASDGDAGKAHRSSRGRRRFSHGTYSTIPSSSSHSTMPSSNSRFSTVRGKTRDEGDDGDE